MALDTFNSGYALEMRLLDPLGLELQMSVSSHVGAGIGIQVYKRLLTTEPSLQPILFSEKESCVVDTSFFFFEKMETGQW